MAKIIAPEKKSLNLHGPINREPVNKNSVEGFTKETDKKVRGTFVNIECPGQTFPVTLKLYKGMNLFKKVFKDQEKCEVPLSVARYLNERCFYTKHKHLQDEKGEAVKGNDEIFRCKFMIEEYV